jgi:hypothetical protein
VAARFGDPDELLREDWIPDMVARIQQKAGPLLQVESCATK